MATATKKSPRSPSPAPSATPAGGRLLRAIDAIYRFLASLKLAVLSLGTLAAVLAYATFFESWYGTSAAQEWIYQTKGFALLLAFLGTNILCAALIRYPWKARQTGFVITHAGLLVLLAGSFWSLKTADEGQVGAMEGEEKSELVRTDYPVIRVLPIDSHTGQPGNEEFRLPFRPGNFAWGGGKPRPRSVFASLFHTLTFGKFDQSAEGEVLSSPGDPFVLKVKTHYPAAIYAYKHEADPNGIPMLKLRPKTKPPQMREAMDAIPDEQERWFAPIGETEVKAFAKFYRLAKNVGPAQFAFLYVDRPEKVADFLELPQKAGPEGVARFRYPDRDGKTRVYDWPLAGQEKKSVTLPDSDLSVTYAGTAAIPAGGMGLQGILGDPEITVANFKVRKGDGPERLHHGWGSLPMLPNVIPNEDSPDPQPLVTVSCFFPPELDAKTNGRFGLVEVLGTPEGALYYRVFGRAKNGPSALRSSGKLEKGKSIVAFGGNPNLPMTLSFEAEEYLPSGRTELICEPIVLPKGQQGQGLAGDLVEMTVKGSDGTPVTKEFWIRRNPTLEPSKRRVSFPSGDYEIEYDVDRKPLGFALKLDDFKVEFDPGTDQPSSYVSQVRLTDESRGIKDKKYTISMNEPLTHRGYTFYQSSYNRERDPKTDRETGRFQSVFQIGIDPGRMVKYLGCVLIVAGAFVQFYMRAGIFTDGGQRERARAEARARKRAGATGMLPPVTDVTDVNESEETL